MVRVRRSKASLAIALTLATAAAGAPIGKTLPLTLAQLVETRDIDGLTLSPAGDALAFRIIMPSVEDNRVGGQWFSLPAHGGDRPVPIGPPMSPMFLPFFDTVQSAAPVWTHRADRLLLLAESTQGVQIHALGPNGLEEAVTDEAADIAGFRLDDDGRTIRYQVRADRSAIAQAQAREEIQGVRLDRTVYPEGLRLTRNFAIGGRWTTLRREGPSYAGEAYAGPLRDRQFVLPAKFAGPPATARPTDHALITAETATAVRLRHAATGVAVSAVPHALSPRDLPVFEIVATLRDGSQRACRAAVCRGQAGEMREIALTDAGEVIILFETNYSGRTSIYGWDPRTDRLRTIRAGTTTLDGGSSQGSDGCLPAGRRLICVEAGPALAPRLVAISLDDGHSETLYDPNPGLRHGELGTPQALDWTDREGRPWTGALLLPAPGSSPPPLVVTSYRCRGMLRGGTANLAPEQLLADRGMAALCVNLNNRNVLKGENRRPVNSHLIMLDGISAIVDRLARAGTIDRKRVGIAGHSFSAMTTAYAISHSDLFAAAVIGTGISIDPASYMLSAPTADSWRKAVLPSMNMPNPDDDPGHVWPQISPALNANRIKAPLLIQPPEGEWLFALQLYTRIQDAGGIVDMYIYPGAGHMMARLPGQLASRAQRSIDWFDHWLNHANDRGQPQGADIAGHAAAGTTAAATPGSP